MMPSKLKVSNVTATGKIPIKGYIDYEKIIKESKGLLWQIFNEAITPIVATKIVREKKELNREGYQKSIRVSIWKSGAINITGVRSLREAEKIYQYIINELVKIKAIKLIKGRK